MLKTLVSVSLLDYLEKKGRKLNNSKDNQRAKRREITSTKTKFKFLDAVEAHQQFSILEHLGIPSMQRNRKEQDQREKS